MRSFAVFLACFFLPFIGGAQEYNLAKNYFEQGEYAKAESVYKKLYQRQKNSRSILKGLVASLQQQKKFDEAGEKLTAFAKRQRRYPEIQVEIGYNYSLQGDRAKAETHYAKANDYIEKHPNYARKIGAAFQDHNLLEQAIISYKTALKGRSSAHFTIQLGKLYGERGDLEKMFSTFLDLITENKRYYYTINRYFSHYIKPDPENGANKILRKTLLNRIQNDPVIVYNKLLSWLYVQENAIKKAFIQQKAIYRRSEDKSLSPILKLGNMAAEKDAYRDAENIFNYALDQAKTDDIKIEVYGEMMNVKIEGAAPENYSSIDKQFQKIFKNYGKSAPTTKLQVQYADFLAFKQKQAEQAKSLLNKALTNKLDRFEEARVKLKLADVLVAEEKFNQALIYYSQVKGAVKNSSLAEKASFKVAKTSYYKGDFDWAQTQLKVLKKSTSELMANDAIALNLLIEDNTADDSTQTALKRFAKADLLAVQDYPEKALSMLDTILNKHKGEKIEDDALLRSAQLHEKLGHYKKAEKAYQKIIELHADGILADDAYYYLAELYRTKLHDPEKAKENYKQIIFQHSDSIFFVEARKQFRRLRGDNID